MSQKSNKGVLYLIAGFLVVSSIIRVASGAGEAIAQIAPVEADGAMEVGDQPSDVEISVLLDALNAREAGLQRREEALADRMQALEVAEVEITARLNELVTAEESLAATIARAEVASEDDLGTLTAVYENMKPADAAALFQEMTPEFAAGFLGRMRPDAAAQILSGLEPVHAYSISVLLAGRNADVPTE